MPLIFKGCSPLSVTLIIFYMSLASSELFNASMFKSYRPWHFPANRTVETLECYSCTGGDKCGLLFMPNSSNVKIVKEKSEELLYSCSVSVSPEGITSRGIMPSHECRSSASQFCCNENLCNHILSPPLPAFTNLKCSIGKCFLSNGICVYDAEYVTTLSSPTESCSVTFARENYKYYKKACQPTIKDTNVASLSSRSTTPDVFCCNSPECNTGHVSSPVKGVAIQCYTCDSRLTGSAGCTVFDGSSPHVYKAGSSSPDEACATIIGLEGKDAASGKPYPAFTIRAIVADCVSQPLGSIFYGGARFKGRIECCSSYLCNNKNLDMKMKARKRRFLIPILIGVALTLVLIVSTIGISYAIFLRCIKKEKDRYGPVAVNDTELALKSLDEKMKKKQAKNIASNDYPEECATP